MTDTVATIFSQLGLPQWWNLSNVTQSFGQNGEEGADYGMGGFGKQIGSITSGKVVYVGNGGYPGSSIGQIVQVQGSDGSLVHYQHLMTSKVSPGQTIQAGQVIGTGGGCPTNGYPSDWSLASCTTYDQFTTGQHIEVRYSPSYNASAGVWTQNWEDPRQIFLKLAGSNATVPPSDTTGKSTGSSTAGSTWSTGLSDTFLKIGLVLIALLLVGAGMYALFQTQIDSAVHTGVHAAKLAVIA